MVHSQVSNYDQMEIDILERFIRDDDFERRGAITDFMAEMDGMIRPMINPLSD